MIDTNRMWARRVPRPSPTFWTLVAALVIAFPLAAQETPGGTEVGTASEGTPHLVVEESTFDWGQLLKGDETEHTFVIRNDGDAPLLIEKVQST